jgi:hypothetical protein
LLKRESVRDSVVPEFPELFRNYLAQAGGYVGRASG